MSGTTYDIQDLNATSVVNVTQAEYDALVTGGTVDPTILYNITDAQAGDLSQYWTSAQTNSAITQATSGKVDTSTYSTYTAATDTALGGKQATLVSGTNIKTINNESILGSGNIDIQGGGGKAIVGGRGITVTSGETADTVSFNLALSAGTRTDSIIGGRSGNSVTPQCSFAFGENNIISYDCAYASIFGYNNKTYRGSTGAHIVGVFNEAKNGAECAVGKNNVSNTGSTDADKTLFSVGNGTADNARHNAFEIRKNGDIYCSDGTNDVKLQDTITATAANTAALGGLKLVKLTQSEYDGLATKDSNTLYIVTDS